MPAQKLSRVQVMELRRRGWTGVRIAKHFGVTTAAVSWHRHHGGGDPELTTREVVMSRFWPWDVQARFQGQSPDSRLRDLMVVRYTADPGAVSDNQLERLQAWFERCVVRLNMVVEYSPDIEPTPGISRGGFAYRTREPGDGNLLIRVNEHTNLTDTGRELLAVQAGKIF